MNAVLWAMLVFCASVEAPAAGQTEQFAFKAGVARTLITPQVPIRMSGYAARSKPSEGVLHDLWAKALALEDQRGNKVVILTADLIALPAELCQQVAAHLKAKHALERSQLLCNASHTHSGPMVWPNLRVMDGDDEQRKVIQQYTEQLRSKLIQLCDAALADLKPARLAVGAGRCTFAVNRREPTDGGVRIGQNPKGPVDHTVPVLRVETPEGKLRAVLFGYACHTTTLGPDIYQINGDYAGFAQSELEKKYPEATAMFIMLCGGDQNPYPRGKVEHAQQYGRALADEVQRVLAGDAGQGGREPLRPVKSHIATAFEVAMLDFPPHDRETFQKELQNPNRYRQRRAALMLEAYDRGEPVRSVACPVQAVRLGDELVLVAIAGEVVIDYALRLKREYPQHNLVVAGYSNDVPCYIPSVRVLREGGYEPVDSMIYYGLPGPLAETVEEKVIAASHNVLRQVGILPAEQSTKAP